MTPPHEPKRLVFVLRYLNYLKNWIDPIYPYLKASGYQVYIFHVDSLSFGLSVDNADNNPDYIIFDVHKAGMKATRARLKEIEPEGVIFLSFRSLFEILLRIVLFDLNIKAIYYQHGLFGKETLDFIMADLNSSFLRYLHLVRLTVSFLMRSRKYRFRYFRIILGAMLKDNYAPLCFERFILYSKKSDEILRAVFGHSSDKVLYSGYPIVSSNSELADTLQGSIEESPKNVLYLAQTFRQSGLTNLSLEEEAEYLKTMAVIFRDNGFSTTIKIHPRASRSEYQEHLEDSGIILKRDENLNTLINESSIVVGHYSTALYSAILLKRPIILYYFPGLPRKNRMFDDIGIIIDSEEELRKFLSENAVPAIDNEKYTEFIEYEIGNNNTYEHLAQTIQESLN